MNRRSFMSMLGLAPVAASLPVAAPTAQTFHIGGVVSQSQALRMGEVVTRRFAPQEVVPLKIEINRDDVRRVVNRHYEALMTEAEGRHSQSRAVDASGMLEGLI